MSKKINTEVAAFYLQDYIASIVPEGAFEIARKHSAQQFIQYIINWHVEPASMDLSKGILKHNKGTHE